MFIIPSEATASEIKARIEGIISDFSSAATSLRNIASELNALPVYLDGGGGLALKPNGGIVEFSWEHPKDAQPIDDLRVVNIALFQGSKKYPELKSLIPLRPPNATVCPYCQGTGYPTSASGSNVENIVCYCGGVGWIP
jgi:hypothetical protein